MLIDETWRFSPEQEQRIKDALSVGGEAAERALPAILFAAQVYRSWKANERDKPSRGEVSRRLKVIAEKCSALKRSIAELDSSSFDYLQDRYYTVAVFEARRHVLWGNLILALDSLGFAASPDPRGRPPAEALGVFVNRLALIWEDSHGKWPGRTYDVYTGKEGGRFRQFVAACLNGVDPARSCPDGIIRSVLRGRKLMEKKAQQSKTSPRPK